MDVPNEFLE